MLVIISKPEDEQHYCSLHDINRRILDSNNPEYVWIKQPGSAILHKPWKSIGTSMCSIEKIAHDYRKNSRLDNN